MLDWSTSAQLPLEGRLRLFEAALAIRLGLDAGVLQTLDLGVQATDDVAGVHGRLLHAVAVAHRDRGAAAPAP